MAVTTDATRIPIFASSCTPTSRYASPATKMETVKPMPATAAMPTTWTHRTPMGRRAKPMRTASQLKALIPTSLPRTRPATTPWVTDEPTASPSASPLSGMPALARAKTGMTM